MRLVLDNEAVSVLLEQGRPGRRTVQRALEAARRLRREVAVAQRTAPSVMPSTMRRWAAIATNRTGVMVIRAADMMRL